MTMATTSWITRRCFGAAPWAARCFLAAVFVSVALASVASSGTLRIMPLGDSITAGFTNGTWSEQFGFGYRSDLYTRLTGAGYDVQYVGSSGEPWDYYSATTPNPPAVIANGVLDLRTVDQDHHRGYAGKGLTYLSDNVVNWLNADNPDIVLLMIGINNIPSGSSGNPTTAEGNLKTLVGKIVATKPNAKVIIAQITPYSTYTNSIVQYNNYIRDTLVPDPLWRGNVSTVNQYSNFLTSLGTIDATLFANGNNHPNGAGYDRMAQTWFNGIETATANTPEPSALVMLAGLGFVLSVFAVWRRIGRKSALAS